MRWSRAAGRRWTAEGGSRAVIRPKRHRNKPFLVDNGLLGQTFREKFVDGFRRRALAGKLRLEAEWAWLREPQQLEAWLTQLTQSDWNVFIEGPPHGQSDPVQVLKYLARYLTGGPISDRRILRDENGQVTFWARSKDKAAGNPSRPFELSGREFVRRWAMHILPQGYTRSRSYGGYHGSQRQDYLARCRALLGTATYTSPPSPQRVEPSDLNARAARSRCTASASSDAPVGGTSSSDRSTPIRHSIRRCTTSATRDLAPFPTNRTDSDDVYDAYGLPTPMARRREFQHRFPAALAVRAHAGTRPDNPYDLRRNVSHQATMPRRILPLSSGGR